MATKKQATEQPAPTKTREEVRAEARAATDAERRAELELKRKRAEACAAEIQESLATHGCEIRPNQFVWQKGDGVGMTFEVVAKW